MTETTLKENLTELAQLLRWLSGQLTRAAHDTLGPGMGLVETSASC